MAQFRQGRVEAGRVAGPDRVRHRPVQRGRLAELFMSEVADRDHEVASRPDVADALWRDLGERQVVASCRRDRAGVDRQGRARSR